MKKLILFFLLASAFGQLSPVDKVAISVNGKVTVSGRVALLSQSPQLIDVAISPLAASIATGATQQFAAQAQYSDGSSFDVTNLASWSSDTPSVATINSSGLATGVSAGTANISATYQGVTSSTPAVLTVTSAAMFTITTTSLPDGTQGSPYNPTINTANGTTPCTGTVSVGALPTGVSLPASSSNCQFTLTGTASTAGTFSFTVSLTDNAAHNAQQSYTVKINSVSPTCGPPYYLCSTTATGILPVGGTLDPTAAYVFQGSDAINTTRYDTTENPSSGTDCQSLIANASTYGGDITGITYDGGSGTEQSSLVSGGTMFITLAASSSKLFKLDVSGNCAQLIYPAPGSQPTEHAKLQAFFSRTVQTRLFQENVQQIDQLDITGSPHPTSYTTTADIFDFSQCPHTPGVGTVPAGSTGWDIGGADRVIGAGFSWSQYNECSGQGCAHNLYLANISNHTCATLQMTNTGGGSPTLLVNLYDWCNPDSNGHSGDHANCVNASPTATVAKTDCPYTISPGQKTGGAHGLELDWNGDWLSGGFACDNNPKLTPFWNIGHTTHVGTTVLFGTTGKTTGHAKSGETGRIVAGNPTEWYVPWNTWPNNIGIAQIPLKGSCEQHPSWENSTADDTWDAIYTVATCDSGTGSTYGLTISQPYQNEFWGVNALLTPFAPVPRFGHNFTTGSPGDPLNKQGAGFACIYAQQFVSQDGNWLFYSSPFLGNFGLTSGGKQQCAVAAVHIQ